MAVNVDWSKAPEWANYFTVDSDGRAQWHENYPEFEHFDGDFTSYGRRENAYLNPVLEARSCSA